MTDLPHPTPESRPRPVRARRGPAGWGLGLLGLAALLLCWPLATWGLGAELFPGPLATLRFLAGESARGTLWGHVGITLWRVLAAFGLALGLGSALGWWLGASKGASNFFAAWLGLLLSVPRLLVLVVAFIVVGLNDRALILAITLILLPGVAVQVREGVRGLDPRLSELSAVFRLTPAQRAWSVVAPQLAPALLGTARVTLSLAWKMVVFGEVFGRTSGVGYMISFYFQGFEMRGILAYGLVMTLIMSVLDAGLSALGGRSYRWQGGEA